MPLAKDVLVQIFFESKTSPSGMMERDMKRYLDVCGTRSSVFIEHMEDLNINGCSTKVLTCRGFLNYYQDAVANSNHDMQVSFFVTLSFFQAVVCTFLLRSFCSFSLS
jgi:hypothetical protein